MQSDAPCRRRARGFVEHLDGDPADVVAHPFVENDREKNPEGLRRHRARADAAVFPLDQRQKLEELDAQVLEEAVDLGRVADVSVVHDAEDVDVDAVLGEPAERAQHLLVRRLLPLVHAVAVVQLARAVDAEADGKALGGEEAAPGVVEQRPLVWMPLVIFFPSGRCCFCSATIF
jgi:hypothetical protein